MLYNYPDWDIFLLSQKNDWDTASWLRRQCQPRGQWKCVRLYRQPALTTEHMEVTLCAYLLSTMCLLVKEGNGWNLLLASSTTVLLWINLALFLKAASDNWCHVLLGEEDILGQLSQASLWGDLTCHILRATEIYNCTPSPESSIRSMPATCVPSCILNLNKWQG